MARKHEGVYDSRGKCRIRWSENGTKRSLVLDIPWSPAGVARAYKTRERHIRAFQKGQIQEGPVPTFSRLAQTRLDTAPITPASRRAQLSYLNNYWLPPFGQTPIDSIRYGDLLQEFADLDRAPKTIKHILSAGSMVFDLAIHSQWISSNPARWCNFCSVISISMAAKS